MTIPEKQIYPRTGDTQTIYLKHVITSPNITVGEYIMASLSTYPFPLFFEEWGLKREEVTRSWDHKGDIVIGNDVWIGYEAVIMAGVAVGDGAIIGTRAKRRYSEETIASLLAARWWDWPRELIAANIEAIQSGCMEQIRSAASSL